MPDKSAFYNPATAAYYDPTNNRRVAIVTGGNSGIGWFTVLHLYLHGYVVYVAGRTESKVLKAIDEIKAEAEKRVAAYSEEEKKERHLGSLTFTHFDCCDLQSVASCATKFLEKEPRLDILINNAGLMGVPYEVTKDGYEIQYQVNFVAPFLFSLLLVPGLLEAKKAGVTPRNILLSSIGHNFAFKYYDPSNRINCTPNFIYTWVRYGNAKAAEIQFAIKLAQLYPDILTFSVHPGVIVDTELYNHWKQLPILGPITKATLRVSHLAMGVTVEEGCLATLRAALDPALTEKDNGKYMETGGVIAKPSKVASNPNNIEKTFTWNLEELEKKGFKFPSSVQASG